MITEGDCFGLDFRGIQNIVNNSQQVGRAGANDLEMICSRVQGVLDSSSPIPIIPFIGVRISWLMFAKNRPFNRSDSRAVSELIPTRSSHQEALKFGLGLHFKLDILVADLL